MIRVKCVLVLAYATIFLTATALSNTWSVASHYITYYHIMITDELISMNLQIFVRHETSKMYFSTTHDCDENVVKNRVYKNI